MSRNRELRSQSRTDKGFADREVGTRDPIPTFLIVCEGEKTEPNYFKKFPVSTRPEVIIVGAGCETISVVNKAIELMANATKPFDRVWCVFDRDPSNVNNTATRFRQALQVAAKENIKVAYSNECFEIWYLLHFHLYNTAVPRSDYKKKLTKSLGCDYAKNSDDMYARLEDKQSQAIKNAQILLASYDPHDPERDNPATTVHLLVEELNRYIR
jgi:RloB-like protein